MDTKHARAPEATRQERIEARVTVEQKKVIERAAALQGQSVSQFITGNAQQAAEQVIRDREVIRLSMRDSMSFAQALIDPPEPSERSRSAAAEYLRSRG